MTPSLLIEGDWPDRITMTRGWARAEARPWNTDIDAAQLRLVRGTSEFLAAASSLLIEMTDAIVYSPAVYPSAARVWRRAGYRTAHRLVVMERPLSAPWSPPERSVSTQADPDWTTVTAVDRLSFEGFWRLSGDGLMEAAQATNRRAVLVANADGEPAGYAIVGSQWGTAYLQRIAVIPTGRGQGLGTALIRASLDWARSEGARSMLLNVRPESLTAHRIYRREGFSDTGRHLEILTSSK